ncbi:hypothetical protein KUC3_05090 [Alteromonas sp. KC3]|uniref:hypothetical protein n=1 Tax=Alteromonas sp. KC3 TaxID=2795688 RepID=UPI001921F792|nr:hypothetical protein [Alteromonas sp. KC3]BCO17652.1 hypothetical protein KUC3_05090 [Alteromonas sp. KC3]
MALKTSLAGWVIGITFTFVSWELAAPNGQNILHELPFYIALLAFPISIIAVVIGVIAFIKGHSRLQATASLLLALTLSTFIGLMYWVAVNGGV